MPNVTGYRSFFFLKCYKFKKKKINKNHFYSATANPATSAHRATKNRDPVLKIHAKAEENVLRKMEVTYAVVTPGGKVQDAKSE